MFSISAAETPRGPAASRSIATVTWGLAISLQIAGDVGQHGLLLERGFQLACRAVSSVALDVSRLQRELIETLRR